MRINIDIPDEIINDLSVVVAIENENRKSWIETVVIETVAAKFKEYNISFKKKK